MKYERPRIVVLDDEEAQASGSCQVGQSDVQCKSGHAASQKCEIGGGASEKCKTGDLGPTECKDGGSADVKCDTGSGF
ncbi:unnamed protein product [marine sediment metagenome]|uniref:Uncharacterized protein n=1 Tax=marine sediment metagenome TaxID=412755 RepID=X0T6A7_9ZZZZ